MVRQNARPYARARKSALLAAITAAVLAGCMDGTPTEPTTIGPPTPRANVASTFPVTTGNTVSDGVVAATIDSATGELRVRHLSTGRVVYATLTPEALEAMTTFITATRIGDANYVALANLDPTQRRPEGQWDAVGGGGLDPTSVSDPGEAGRPRDVKSNVVMRRAQSTRAPEREPLLLPWHLSSDALDRPAWDENCSMWAYDIGQHRLTYGPNRQSMMDRLRGVPSVPDDMLEWRHGKPYLTLPQIQSYFYGALVEAAAVLHRSWQLDIMRGMYNGIGCQNPIEILHPMPGQVFVGRSATGGGTAECRIVTQLWEISFDGGLTWYPFTVDRPQCAPLNEQ